MSTELIAAMCNRVKATETPALTGDALAAQTALIAALAADRDTGTPSFWYGNANQAVVYPCVTFRFSGGSPDDRFSDGTISVEDKFLDIDIWENEGVAATITDIDKLLLRLFDERKDAPQLPLANGMLAVSFMAFTGLMTDYDEKRNAWFGMRRWKIIEVD